MWHRRKVLPRQQEARHPASSSSSKWRQIPPDLHALCFRYFEEGHRRPDCTNDPLFIRCGFSGHVSSQCTRPRNPISVEELRKAVIAKASKARPAPRLDHDNERSLVGCAHLPSRAVFPPGDGGPVGGVHCTEVSMAPQHRVANRVAVSDPDRIPNGSQRRLVPAEVVVHTEERMPAGEFELVKSGELGVSDDRDKLTEVERGR
ncbi:hypothetical protein ZWY2020_057166 [Hordeum vulgare]|nr:hypothetical protein ZWY2020_057166 [Hordeum vulgare]